jgi:hypothetical protein
MKNKLLFCLTAVLVFLVPAINFGQAPNLGSAVNFVLFSTNGAVSNTGVTHLTGHVGTNSGSSTGFGNVDGGMHDNDLVSAAASSDLLLAYGQLNSAIPTNFPGLLLGNGVILNAGVHSIPASASLNLELILDGQGDPNALFIFQINGAFSTNANSKVKLINGAQACNVFWKVEGLVDMATGTTMRGTIVANNSAILMNVGDTLEGRALSIAGAITVDGIFAYKPIGCGSLTLTGPIAPTLNSIACFGVFSADGPVTNAGVSFVTGDVGTNVGLTTGFNPLNVTGTLHLIPNATTVTAASDLTGVYNYLNGLPADIELLYPAQFGNNLVLTPHTYILNGAVTFTDTLYLDGQDNAAAVFVIQINGAMSTSTYSRVILTNGTQPENVFWKVDGAVEINDYSIFVGTLVANNGAIDLKTGVSIDGRALTTSGALNTSAISTTLPDGCGTIYNPAIVGQPQTDTTCVGSAATFTVLATGTDLTYQWRKGTTNLVNGGSISGATSSVLTIDPVTLADYGTDYNVVVDGAAATSATSVNATLAPCVLGLESFDRNNVEVVIYPNPFSNSVTVILNAEIQSNQTQFSLYNILGEVVFTTTLINSTTLIGTEYLEPGVYFYSITSDNEVVQTGKLISKQ